MSRILIDTQALIWFAEDTANLSKRAVGLVDDPTSVRLFSAASLWEMAIKIQLGKLILKSGTLRQFLGLLKTNSVEVLPIVAEDAIAVGDLPSGTHKDPFDRLIAAQCLRHDLTLISSDKTFDSYGVRRVW